MKIIPNIFIKVHVHIFTSACNFWLSATHLVIPRYTFIQYSSKSGNMHQFAYQKKDLEKSFAFYLA